MQAYEKLTNDEGGHAGSLSVPVYSTWNTGSGTTAGLAVCFRRPCYLTSRSFCARPWPTAMRS